MKNKKGALQLSVNAVVVIIIAIVMLGLALTFMRTIFGGVIEEFEEVRGEIRKQMEETLRGTTTKAALSTNSLDLKAGDEKRIYLGINNYLSDDADFCIACPNCNRERCPNGKDINCLPYEGETQDCIDAIDVSVPGINKYVLRGKIDVIPLTVKVKSVAKSDTYLVPIHIIGTERGGTATIEDVLDLYVSVK